MRNDIVKSGVVLFIITLITSGILGIVSETTKGAIESDKLREKQEAMALVLPDNVDEFSEESIHENDDSATGEIGVSEGYDGDDLIGYAISLSAIGYGGPINMLVGLDTEGVVTGVNLVEHSETPGLGDNTSKPEFTGQYVGKSGEFIVTKVAGGSDNEIVAVTSATISSDAVTEGVNLAISIYESILKGGQ